MDINIFIIANATIQAITLQMFAVPRGSLVVRLVTIINYKIASNLRLISET